VEPFEGFHEGEGVTADVAGDENLEFPEDVKKSAVGTAGT
jgi:hypothetical protein